MARISPDALEYLAVEVPAITRKYENLAKPVTTSSDKASANALRSSLFPVYLKGRTATQKPSSERSAPESVTLVRTDNLEMGVIRDVLRARSRNSLLTS